MSAFEVVSVNISGAKGVPKVPVPVIVLAPDVGVVGDAHAGPGKRQVSLLAAEDINAAISRGINVVYGSFAENITTTGIDLAQLPIGTTLTIGEAVLQISQIGKKCHTGCSIMKSSGDCIMPKRGVFARVIRGGEVRPASRGEWREPVSIDANINHP